MLGRIVVVTLAVAVLSTVSLTQAAVDPREPQVPSRLGKEKQQALYAPFWTLEPGWSTHLQIRNSLEKQSVTVTPVLRQFAGREVPLTSRTIGPNESVEIDVAAEVAKAAPELVQATGAYGSVEFKFTGTHGRNIYADAMVTMPGHPIAFHFDALMQDAAFTAGSQESIWWLPKPSASDVLIVSNSGTRPVQGWVELYGQTGLAARKRLAFGPGQTAKLDVGTFVRASKLQATFGGLRVRFDADGGFVQVAHLIYDELGGYSAILKPFDRGAPTDLADRHYIAAMVALSNPDPVLALPSGTTLVPELILRNASDKALAVDLNASWRGESASGIARLGVVSLNANETRVVSLDTYQQKGGAIPATASWAAIHAKYHGARGDLVAISAAHDSTFKYLLQSPFTDARSFSWRGGVWRVDSTHNSLITTGNAGDKPARAKVTLRYGTGVYELPEKTLQPGESLWINVRDLMRNQIPDRAGNTIPPDVTAGVYEFDQVDDDMIGSLYEGKLVLDSTYGQASYGCANCCGYYALGLSPDPFGIGVGLTGQDRIYVENACTGLVSERTTLGYNWGTGNTSIAGINSTGLLSAFTPGQTTSGASVSLRTPDVWHCPQAVQGVSNAVKVLRLSCTPTSVTRGSSISCAVTAPTGSTFSSWKFTDNNSNQVVRSGSGSTSSSWSGVMVTGGTIQVDVTPSGASSATTLTASVTVNNRTNFAFTAASVGAKETNPYTCVAQVGSVTISVNDTPQAGSSGNDFIGMYCDIEDSAFNGATIGTGGPNAGYSYVTSPINQASFHWIIAGDADNPSSAFYNAQCGNWNGSTGFISGAHLRANTINHESGTVRGHYGQYVAAQNNAANNVGVGYESIVVFGDLTALQNAVTNSNDLIRRIGAIEQATANESTLFDVNHDASGVYDGPINFSPYDPCN
jgi:hypothetical protein